MPNEPLIIFQEPAPGEPLEELEDAVLDYLDQHPPKCEIVFSGRLRAEVIDHLGQVIQSTPWQPNLLLDQGMNNLALMSIADIFTVCVKGTDNTATSETVDPANDYSQGGTTLSKTAGPRLFTTDDEGKHFRTVTGGFGGTITQWLTDTTVIVDTNQSFSGRDLVLWHVEQDILEDETDVADAGGSGALVSKAALSNTVSTTGDFTLHTDIVGKAIYFPSVDRSFYITSIEGDGTLRITLSGDDFSVVSGANVLIYTPTSASNLRARSRTDIYSAGSGDNGTAWSGATTGAGAHPDHIKTLTRTFVFDASTATETIRELGFSDSDLPGPNLNIRVKLASPVVIDGPVVSPATPGQQLRVTYQMVITFPTVSVAQTAPIDDTAELMSTSKTGFYAIEGPFCSGVATNGESINTNPVLDPYYEAKAVISTNADSLQPLAFPTRSGGYTTDTVEQNSGVDAAGVWEKTFVATWGGE